MLIREVQGLVSVVTPCYGDGAWLEACRQSVAAQTYAPVEWIVVDDGSEDEVTRDALSALKAHGVTVVRGHHQGPAAARNLGIANAHGTWILPLDADDTIDPTYLAKAVDAMLADPARRLVYCRADLTGALNGPWELPDFEIGRFLADNIVFVTSLFYRADWVKAGGFAEGFDAGLEDYDFFMTLLEQGAEFYCLPDTLFHYCIREDSRTQRLRKDDQRLRDTYALLFARHKALYHRHWDACVSSMRDIILDQRHTIDCLHASESELARQLAGKSTPLWRKVLRTLRKHLGAR